MVLGVLGRRALLSTRTVPVGAHVALGWPGPAAVVPTCGSPLPLPAQCLAGEADHTKGWEHTAAWPRWALIPGKCVLELGPALRSQGGMEPLRLISIFWVTVAQAWVRPSISVLPAAGRHTSEDWGWQRCHQPLGAGPRLWPGGAEWEEGRVSAVRGEGRGHAQVQRLPAGRSPQRACSQSKAGPQARAAPPGQP